MLIILNLFIVLCLLGCITMWATYGFFSAFVQMMIVIAAGVLAFALWEPVSYMLLGRMPAYAHGIGLLAPFILLLIVIRTVLDKLCKANVHMPRIADQAGGAVCGGVIGVLAFGILLNGVNYLPIEHDAMGWQVTVGGQNISDDESGALWLDVAGWSGGFFSMLSGGSMSPMGNTIPLIEARPALSDRALTYRTPPDPNQMRSAHPESVQVTGAYAIAATEDNIYGLAKRSAILAFLAPSYELPKDYEQGEDGLGLVNAILADLQARADDPDGKPSQMLNIQAIMEVSRTPQYNFPGAASVDNFEAFIDMVADKMGQDLVKRLETVTSENKVLYAVDTRWNNDRPGTFNTDGKLRIAVSSVQLQAETEDGFEMIDPMAYSIQYSQNTQGRIFTEIISQEADPEDTRSAYSKYTELSMGWFFSLNKGQKPTHFFVRELRFDLSKLEKAEGQESVVNTNIGSFAQVAGAPLLPSPADLADSTDPGNVPQGTGVKIVGTDTYAELNEQLPGPFTGSAVALDFNKDADPWELIAGKAERIPAGKGGKRSTVRAIQVSDTDRLVRIELNNKRAKSLYGRAIGLAEGLNTIGVKDEGGNFYDSIGFVLKRPDRSLNLDIRKDARQRGVSVNELPEVLTDEVLMLYFQVPVGTKLSSFVLGSKEQEFEETLVVEKGKR